MGIERRKFIRHPLSYPVKTRILSGTDNQSVHELISKSENIGAGGILFFCDRELSKGTEVEIELRVEHRCFALDGWVVRTEKAGEGKFSVAVAFKSPSEILKVRMMEQIVRIEMFKNRVERRFNVTLDFGSVAKEWIRRYSKSFAEHYDL